MVSSAVAMVVKAKAEMDANLGHLPQGCRILFRGTCYGCLKVGRKNWIDIPAAWRSERVVLHNIWPHRWWRRALSTCCASTTVGWLIACPHRAPLLTLGLGWFDDCADFERSTKAIGTYSARDTWLFWRSTSRAVPFCTPLCTRHALYTYAYASMPVVAAPPTNRYLVPGTVPVPCTRYQYI